MIAYIKILRIQQWYKNLFIFLPIIFNGILLSHEKGLIATEIGFISLCLISSAGYIINDIFDRKHDKVHPEKRGRPIASGKISVISGAIYASFILLIGCTIAYLINTIFLVFGTALFFSTLIYSLFLKHEAFIDIIAVSGNFVLRSVSGAYVLLEAGKPYIPVSPWLILCPFFLALFIITGKRASDALLLKQEGKYHKKVLSIYTIDVTRQLTIIATTLLLFSYFMYILNSPYEILLFTLPFALYIIFRYYYLIEAGSRIPRHPHLIFKDIRLVTAFILFTFVTGFAIY
jgi:4-hydroxybenzoate polyprenyltransferase